MRKRKLIANSLLLLLLGTACAPKVKEGYDEVRGYTGNISISGAFALYPIVVLWSEDFKKIHPNVRFNISAGGAGKGISDVLSNMVDIGLVSRDLHPQELQRGAFPIHVAKDAVVGTINRNHPNFDILRTRGLTQKELVGIFVEGRYRLWSDIDPQLVRQPIEVYVRSDAAGAAETWAKFLGERQEGLKGVGIFGDPGLAQAVKEKPLAIGFNNINYVFDLKTKRTTDRIAVLPIDVNNNGRVDSEEDFYDNLDSLVSAVATDRYPSPPARDLTFILRSDKQTKLLQAFVRFVLDKEQQGYLLENGYVPLNEELKTQELNKL
ncbi:phosphate transport system substrate-binding protein [Sphingobacterium allocomposti]|uniref:Phosphate transport system substrate-binding protein n=1 Tax=Sphingobacterium allocomposti TaxID=415956 RepID=A0A5S5DFJ0_9SPHI|nr:PstS family phosphate ABC transporter substrate-binding protein [Sphingobacterium composti Yoo et al. 2007 non Ten et al. 2007]TYP94394.1 phosphate transport system substrate-binding protein [Sphingobacterium composti Yoo et al. 2007 non Ten et al. 2007]